MRFESRGFLRYDSSFALRSGKSVVVDFWVRPLELKEEKTHGENLMVSVRYLI